MRTAFACLCLFTLNAAAENLLKNPGFETVGGTTPADWNVYVQPREGASAEVDYRVAKLGNNSARLVITTPYAEDPANNWSQNIIGDFRGKRLIVEGAIKTENAGEAAIWVQCFQKNPLTMVLQQSTALDELITGTQDWTNVKIAVDAPLNTDFIVVRCVLRWRGTAWFDALSVESSAETPAIPDASATPAMPTLPSMPSLPVTPAPDKAPTKASDAKTILDAHEELRKANDWLRKSNASLSQQLETLQKQIEELKQEVVNTSAAAKQLQQDVQPMQREEPVRIPPPPLVPVDETGDDN
ncbi:MAG: hypothetical protein SGI88_21145 [Candidatus Hydrogenedentes bacterium]|nr:hypothetical protein [Candidatus Hydrogenedentota bacterium]